MNERKIYLKKKNTRKIDQSFTFILQLINFIIRAIIRPES